MSNTPRTDEREQRQKGLLCGGANLDLCRELERENARLRNVATRLQNCASALLGWHSDSMSLGAVREITETVREADQILKTP